MVAFYIFGGILLILVVAVVAAPLLENRTERGVASGRAPEAAGRLEEAIESLRALEFEFQTGKIARQDYERLRAALARRALAARDELGREDGVERGRCAVCEAELAEGARFCSRCGSPIEEGSSPAAGPEAGEGE